MELNLGAQHSGEKLQENAQSIPLLPCNALCTIDPSLLSSSFSLQDKVISKVHLSTNRKPVQLRIRPMRRQDESGDGMKDYEGVQQLRCTFEGTQRGTNVD